MSHCIDCGTKLSNGICPNCSEELFIYTEQSEYLPEKLSKDFVNKVNNQRIKEKHRKHYEDQENQAYT